MGHYLSEMVGPDPVPEAKQRVSDLESILSLAWGDRQNFGYNSRTLKVVNGGRLPIDEAARRSLTEGCAARCINPRDGASPSQPGCIQDHSFEIPPDLDFSVLDRYMFQLALRLWTGHPDELTLGPGSGLPFNLFLGYNGPGRYTARLRADSPQIRDERLRWSTIDLSEEGKNPAQAIEEMMATLDHRLTVDRLLDKLVVAFQSIHPHVSLDSLRTPWCEGTKRATIKLTWGVDEWRPDGAAVGATVYEALANAAKRIYACPERTPGGRECIRPLGHAVEKPYDHSEYLHSEDVFLPSKLAVASQ